MENFSVIIIIMLGIIILGLISAKYKFPFPIVLVLAGLCISLIPGLPTITLNPEVVFLIFLPALLYGAAWNTNLHEFKSTFRSITMAAVALVLFTVVIIAIVAHAVIPGIDWPLAFLIGAIVSPPDAVAAASITKGLGLHPRLLAILEGESLLNDASGLIAYKYALAAILAGNFVLWQASLNFLLVAFGGIAIGLILAHLIFLVHKTFICDAVIEVSLTILTPFMAYLLAEHFHCSGVLAVVTAGLYLSYRSSEMLSNQSRIIAFSVWEVVLYILNSLVFILIGLQLRSVVQGISNEYSYAQLALYGTVISLAVILARFIYVYPAAYIPRLLSKKIRKEPFLKANLIVFGWAGMRGVVSMAAAMALPLTMPDGSAFAHRNLVIYLTFCVILTTLVLLGLTLPWVIRKLKIIPYSIVSQEYEVRTKVVSEAITHIEANLSLVNENLLNNIKSKYEVKFNRLQKTDLPSNYFGNGNTLEGNIFNEFSQMQIDLIAVERKSLQQLHKAGEANEEILRKMERELDLEETRLEMEMYTT